MKKILGFIILILIGTVLVAAATQRPNKKYRHVRTNKKAWARKDATSDTLSIDEYSPEVWVSWDSILISTDVTYNDVEVAITDQLHDYAVTKNYSFEQLTPERDERIDILQLVKEKTALFVTISDMDRSQDMLANLFYTQALQTLCHYADKECEDHCLPIPVRFILDDFATNARIPDFDKMISVIRSRGIAVSIILQSQTQLELMYGVGAATTILNGCDTLLYLGGQDLSTAHYIGTRVNKPDFDVLTMPLDQAWLLQRGYKPRLVKRYDLTSHPRYHLLPEAKKTTKPAKTRVSSEDEDLKEVAHI